MTQNRAMIRRRSSEEFLFCVSKIVYTAKIERMLVDCTLNYSSLLDSVDDIR